MAGPIVLLTDNDLGDRRMERALLEEKLDAKVVIADCVSEDDVLAAVEDSHPDAIVTQWAPITARVLDAAQGCRIVSRIGIGVDMIDLVAARERGIPVQNVPHYCTEEVATHAVAMAFALWRRLPQLDAELRAGTWNAAASAPSISRLSEATVGIIGGGRIGMMVARAFEVWGARILVVDPLAGVDPYPRVSLAEVAEQCSVISMHAPLMDSTYHVINADFLDSLLLRPVLVNTSRGGLIDVDAVVGALARGALRGAGLDVFESEPLAPDHAIRDAPNALLTPHAAWCSVEALPELREEAILNVVRAFTSENSMKG
jgi:D-3-phosphoglycerate dehydrogenase / 2-oxoglutarate reductase